jgi:hypothetical protein
MLMACMVLSAPLLACTLPGLSMSEEEKECCRHMADQCGSSQMEESHSCCKTAPGAPTGTLQPTVKFSPVALGMLGQLAPGPEQACVAIDVFFSANSFDYSKSPPGQISVLRI